MKKARLINEKEKDVFLYDTRVANLFINELLPKAPGDYVKVYLFGLMYAQMNYEMDLETMGHDLDMSVEEVQQAFEYWARHGVVKIYPAEDGENFEIEYKRLVQMLYGSGGTGQKEERPQESRESIEIADRRTEMLNDEEVRMLFKQYEQATGRMLSSKELDKLRDAIRVYNIPTEVYSYAIQYCKEIEKYSIDYINKVALRWTEEGCRNTEDVKKLLDRHSQRNAHYNAIFREMGFHRTPNPADREMMAKWFDEWGYTIKEVLDACRKTAGQREPSLKYVNKVLENQIYKSGGIDPAKFYSADGADRNEKPPARVSKQVLKEYFEYLQADSIRKQDARNDEVCAKLPEMRGIYQMIQDANHELLNLNLVRGSKEKRAELRERMRELDEEKRRLLVQNGYSEDYLERQYKCRMCKDTGTTEDGRVCVCNAVRAEEAFQWMREKNKR